MMRHWLFGALFILGVTSTAMGLGACDSDEGDELLQCTDICTAYIDCTDSETDLDDCIAQCEDQESNTSPEFEGCEDCVDQNACEAGQWQCASECAAVIDQSTATEPVQ
jgi:hypothetical protein